MSSGFYLIELPVGGGCVEGYRPEHKTEFLSTPSSLFLSGKLPWLGGEMVPGVVG